MSDALLTSLRVQLAEGEDLVKLAREDGGGPVSLKNELQVFRTILAACESMFREYPTSVEDDKARLEKKSLPQNTRNAVRVRLGEKEVLQATVSNIVAMWRDFLVFDFPPVRPGDEQEAKEGEDAPEGTGDSKKEEL